MCKKCETNFSKTNLNNSTNHSNFDNPSFDNQNCFNQNRKEYEENIKKIQEEHLKKIKKFEDENWQPCLHDGCSLCHGTGKKLDGTICVHHISCPCPKCSPRY